jgi:hypothetical protein
MVFADTNDDIRTGQVNAMFRSLNLKEHISGKHGQKRPLPSTQIRNKSNKPIDGIWSNLPDLTLDCGYYAFFDAFQSDHRTMWIRIPKRTLLGYRPPHIHKVQLPDLPTGDPRSNRRYNKRIRSKMREENIPAKIRKLRRLLSAPGRKNEEEMSKIRRIHSELSTFRQLQGTQALQKLNLKHTGAIPYSPQIRPAQ